MAKQEIPDSGLWSSIAAIINSNFDQSVSVTPLIRAKSVAASQEPSSLDTPIQVEYGPQQATSQVEISANGTVLFKETGLYYLSIHGQYGSPGGGGEAALRFRGELNGLPIGDVYSATVKDTKTSVPLIVPFFINAIPGDDFKTFLLRDSSYTNKGGLFREDTALAGWDDSPCAALSIDALS